jgi:hypothetical protein
LTDKWIAGKNIFGWAKKLLTKEIYGLIIFLSFLGLRNFQRQPMSVKPKKAFSKIYWTANQMN